MADVVENLNDLHKQVYGNGVPDLIPNLAKIQQEIKFSTAEMIGAAYNQAVRLSYPNGFTHAKGDGTEGAFTLNDAKAGTQKKASLNGAQILLKDHLPYEDAFKASSSKVAFMEGTKFYFEGLQKSMRKRIETELLYGGQGIGVVETYTSGDPSVVISAATWAAGIWVGLEGAEIDVQSANTSTVRGSVTIAGIDVENRKLTLSGTVTGCTAGDYLYFKGAYGKEMTGIHGILSNTGSLWGIDASVYSLWKPTTHAVGSAALSFGAIKKAIAKATNKGLDEDVTLFVSAGGWDDLMSDISALRTIDKSEVKKVEVGAEELVYHSQNGKTRVIAHPMVMQGNAYGLCLPYVKRIGAVDVTFADPMGGKMFRDLETKAGIEGRCYTNQAIFVERPASGFILTGIVNS